MKCKLARVAEIRSRQERKQNLTKYIPTFSKAIFDVLRKASEHNEDRSYSQTPIATTDLANLPLERPELLSKVRAGEITETTLAKKLSDFIEQAELGQALEFVSAKADRTASYQLLPLRYTRDYLLIKHALSELRVMETAIDH